MSCGQIALRELSIPIENYFASEVDEFAIAQTQLNFPDTVQLGDVRSVHAKDLPKIDLLIGGSPCQGFGFAGKQLNFDDPRSVLFFEFVRILKELREINPEVKFLLENVRMKKEYEAVISEQLGVQPVMINSALVSAQNRVRLYWSNIRTRKEGLFGEVFTDIPQPEDRGVFIADILEGEGIVKSPGFGQPYVIQLNPSKESQGKQPYQQNRVYDVVGKSPALCANLSAYNINTPTPRHFTPTECARLQTIPEWYKWGCSESQQYKMLGNGWTVEVIKHILKYLIK